MEFQVVDGKFNLVIGKQLVLPPAGVKTIISEKEIESNILNSILSEFCFSGPKKVEHIVFLASHIETKPISVFDISSEGAVELTLALSNASRLLNEIAEINVQIRKCFNVIPTQGIKIDYASLSQKRENIIQEINKILSSVNMTIVDVYNAANNDIKLIIGFNIKIN